MASWSLTRTLPATCQRSPAPGSKLETPAHGWSTVRWLLPLVVLVGGALAGCFSGSGGFDRPGDNSPYILLTCNPYAQIAMMTTTRMSDES